MQIFKQSVKLRHQIISVLLFLGVIFYGLFLPFLVNNPNKMVPLSVETIMIISITLVSSFILIFTNKKWDEVFTSMVESIKNALPGLLILIVIGPLIAAFIMSGLMPMLVYYGVTIINVKFLYVIAFILAALFSTFTGTSWGSAATIGVVMMGITVAVQGEMSITAGAVVCGAYFGDKMSPLSDTTNIAAIASDVNLYDHIQSMMWTTIPASIISIIVFLIAGFRFPATITNINDPNIVGLLKDLSGIFNFNVLLLIPLIFVLVGSATKKPVLPVMAIGSFLGFVFALIFQDFSLKDVLEATNSGFSLRMVSWHQYLPAQEGSPFILGFFERGGIWELGNLLPISISILSMVGVLNSIEAMQGTANALFGWAQGQRSIIISSLGTAIAMIAITANGIACSFVTAEIFKKKYDDMGIDRRVLSRTTEDAGTLLEVLFPWTPAAIFFSQTLGVPVSEYAKWAVLNWSTSLVAILLALTGIGLFSKSKQRKIKS